MLQIYKSLFRHNSAYFREMNEPLNWETFSRVEMRVGQITQVSRFPEARNPSYIVSVDFGDELGLQRTSAQVTARYEPDELIGKRIVAVTNFPSKQIGPMMSEFLLLGALDEKNGTAVLEVAADVPLGTRIG